MPIGEQTVRNIHDQRTLLEFLERELHWPLPESPIIDDVTFEWTATDLRLSDTARNRLADGSIRQLRPMANGQPWGIFLVTFNNSQVYKASLREVLRGLVPKRRRDATLPGWKHENLLFICMTADKEFTFAHFRGEKPERAKLVRFSWSPDEPIRTICEFNLPALRWPDQDIGKLDPLAWLKEWSKAFDVEKVTTEFFREYKRVFENAESLIRGIDIDDKRLYTQKLFNRLLFVRFLEKKGWLRFNKRTDYLRALWDDYQKDTEKGSNFYRDRLRPLFFLGLNAPNDVNQIGINRGGQLGKIIGKVAYLNGGLFEKDETDQDDKIVIPDKAIEPAFAELLYHFNFTVTESTPLDVDVAVDPEMLGRIFEELVTGRHKTGSYYTPRSVVAFMCREALKGYLGGYEALVEDRNISGITVPQARELLNKIATITVVDPACGSGAYLLGMLHELHDIIRLLDTRTDKPSAKDDYERKLNIIQNSLYGVDIDPFATNIARLRLWLSLAVDYEGDDPPPLPNLDFKIESGDSLTAPNPHELPDLFREVLLSHADKIANLKARHMRSHHGVKQQLTAEILKEEEALTKAFRDYPAPKGSFDWRVRFAEVFRHDGFDVVLANPPYGVTCEDPLRFQYFPRLKGEDPQSKDSYGLFMARALQLLKPKGFFTYIVSDTWRTIRTHRPLRKLLLNKTTVLHVLDLPSWIFKATVNTCILSLRNEKAQPGHQLIAGDLRNLPANDWNTLEANLAAVAAHAIDVQTTPYARYTYPQETIRNYQNLSFFVGSPMLHELMRDMRFARFSDIADVKVGLQTSDNEFYLRKSPAARGSYAVVDLSKILSASEIRSLTARERTDGIHHSNHSGKAFLPFDKGGESEADAGWLPNFFVPTEYYIDWSQPAVSRLKSATIADVKRRKGEDEKILPGDEEKLAAVIRNPEYYFRNGITFSPTGVYSPSFRLGCGAIFGNKGSTIFVKRGDELVFLGVLCSTLARYLWKNFRSHTVETGEEVIGQLPIPDIPPEISIRIRTLVDQIIENQKENPQHPYHLHEQRQIDKLVYEMYGLNEEDIREIELWYCRRYPLLAEAQGVLAEVKQKYAAHLARCELILSKPPSYWKSHPILQLVAQGEGPQLEFKETFEHNIKTDQKDAGVMLSSLKTVAAYLNTEGGTLLIGVSDAGEIKGLERDYQYCNKHDKDGLEQKLRNLLSSRFNPVPLGNVVIRFEQLPDGEVCVVQVTPIKRSDVVHLDKEVYVRDGNVTRKLDGPDLTRWVAERAKS